MFKEKLCNERFANNKILIYNKINLKHSFPHQRYRKKYIHRSMLNKLL